MFSSLAGRFGEWYTVARGEGRLRSDDRENSGRIAMSPDAPEVQKLSKEAPPPPAAQESNAGAATDEDVLRLRSRLDRELAVVSQKLIDAEEAVIDMEVALRSHETGSRPRLPSASAPSGEKGTERITARLKAVGDGINRFKDWVVKK